MELKKKLEGIFYKREENEEEDKKELVRKDIEMEEKSAESTITPPAPQ
mgnify:CR=1 FL=1